MGNHHVFATKKYVLAKVINQMTIRRTSPIERDLLDLYLGLPQRNLRKFLGPREKFRYPQRGEA